MSLTFIEVTRAAESRWIDLIFPAFGIETPPNKQHGPCPACGGSDRFRCDDQGGKGTYFCNSCGAGDGFALVSLVRGLTSSECLHQVAGVVGITKSEITDAQRDQWRKEAEAKRIADEKEKQRLFKVRAKSVKTRWSKLDTEHDSPYLQRKGIDQLYGCKTDAGGLLYVPMHDVDGAMWNLQTIHPSGFKAFEEKARVSGNFHTIGALTVDTDLICIVEGFATGASVYMASELTTIVAFNSNNLKPVSLALRAQYPNMRFLFCADNDAETAVEYPNLGNVGIVKATEAANIVGGRVIYPDFGYSVEDIQAAVYTKIAEKDALINAVDEEEAV